MAIKDYPPEKRKFVHSLIFPALFLFTIWVIKIIELVDQIDFGFLGVFPRRIEGLPGIVLSPLIHANFKHLINNSVSLFFLSVGVFYFYNKVAYRVFFFIYLFTGTAVWIFARSYYHIGASGLIYGFGSFLFFSGIIKQNIHLLAISLLVAFLYGSMVWGIFPFQYEISWESHLAGGAAGFILSIIYRKTGPPPTRHDWPEDEDDEDDNEAEENQVTDETLSK